MPAQKVPYGLCKRRFDDLQGLNQHLRSSGQHVICKRCQRGFRSGDALKQYLQKSPKHQSRGHPAQNLSKNELDLNPYHRKTFSQLVFPDSKWTLS
ncbi:hypothetical protein GJ744_004912 [Endocarpon pusillum]|uniref:C2H2-type domain-containing protein n=1 Tax=Endocarpon pusillum TaxID=364733 RepID=A0A8H7E6Q5_9EURO|nr:hypothetical protein GJ744_004912 [Endocarpon pusillum]